MKPTKMCHGCREQFRREELIDYASPGSVTMYSYCPKCLKEKQDREKFSDKVCSIFGIKSPGPRIWTERKRLQDKYGYTDDVIVHCLDYIYNVEKKKKYTESLCLVTPPMVEKAQRWQKTEETKANLLAQAAVMSKDMPVQTVSAQYSTKRNKVILNADDFLD